MQVAETVIIVIYIALLIAMGIYFSRRAQRSATDYWSAGRKINSFIGGVALFAALASASSLIGAVGGGVSLGLPFFMTYAFAATAILTFTVLLNSGHIRHSGSR